jgi:hypothetical protein
MHRSIVSTVGFAAGLLLALAAACSRTPTQRPSDVAPDLDGGARADGVTLKIDAPPMSTPANGVVWTWRSPLVLSVGHVRGRYGNFPVSYEAQVQNSAGAVVASAIAPQNTHPGASITSIPIIQILEGDVPLTWRARARFGSAVGPWSSPRTVRLERTAVFRLDHGAIDVGAETAGIVGIHQQGEGTDCTSRAIWTSNNPAVAAIIGRAVRGVSLGDADLRAQCDDLLSDPVKVRVVEFWQGQFVHEECVPVFGPTNGCRPLAVRNARLEITQRTGSTFRGEIGLEDVALAVTGSTDGLRVRSVRGYRFLCRRGFDGDENVWHDLKIDDDRVTLEFGVSRSRGPGTCAEIETRGPDSRWTIRGRVMLSR